MFFAVHSFSLSFSHPEGLKLVQIVQTDLHIFSYSISWGEFTKRSKQFIFCDNLINLYNQEPDM